MARCVDLVLIVLSKFIYRSIRCRLIKADAVDNASVCVCVCVCVYVCVNVWVCMLML